MSEKQHTVAIGAFVIGAFLIAVTTLLFLAGSGFGKKEKVVMVFDSSVKGLNVGAPLALRGVQVGQVTRIDLILDSDNVDFIMMVEADFNASNIRREGSVTRDLTEELIARGLRAQLNTQSLLTGLLYIQLDFFPDSEIRLADIDSPHFQFPTIPTDLERITKKLQDVDFSKFIDDMNNITDKINSLVSSDDFQNLPAKTNDALGSLNELSEQLRGQLDSTGPKLDTVLDETATAMANANKELPQLSALVESNLKVLDDAITAFEQGMRGVDGLVSPDSETMYRLNKALKEMALAGRSLQSLARTLEEQPESLIRGKTGDN